MSNINFTMTYLALKMFGKQLYANMSAAIAELVANGLDANAQNVYVYMDIRNRENATIAVYDDGDGMDEENMRSNYAVVGRNKRDDLTTEEASTKMGRKGIGKLAALYLSNTYYIITKKATSKGPKIWMLDVSNYKENDKEPELIELNYKEINHIFQKELFDSGKGTIILLKNVLIKNFGEAAEDALEYRLANYFLTNNMARAIKVCILKNDCDKIIFRKVEKNIAFKNMSIIFTSDTEIFKNIAYDKVWYRDKNLPTKEQKFGYDRQIFPLPDMIDATIKDENGKSEKVSNKSMGSIVIDGKEYPYSLKGWIGIHSTIENNDAKLNCNNFRKNMHYNPNQLRVYVRNKLATPNFLNYLGMTATFLNYIEGEISFDILDAEGLEDIATAGRDNFAIQDVRVKLLSALAKGIVSKLVNERQKIADVMNESRKQIENKIEEDKKQEIQLRFRKGANKSKQVFEKLSNEDKAAIEDDYVQFSRASNLSNETSFIFISHKHDCREFGEFLIDVLLQMYPSIKSRIVFSSNSDFGIPQGLDILDYLKTCFRADLHVVFLFSKSYYDSNVCLAEAGAAWGTNKQYSNFVIDIGFGDIDNPINRNQKGSILVNMKEQDFKDFAKELIRILKLVGVDKEFVLEEVLEIVNETFEKHKDRLLVPYYMPYRKFQVVPKCNICHHSMKAKWENGIFKYSCACGNSLDADIY